MINAEVQKSGSETALSVIRKFSRRVQGTGLIQTVRKRRYYARNASHAVSKKQALKRIKRRETFHEMVKEGKIAEPQPRGRRPMQRESTPRPTEEGQVSKARSSGLGEATPIAR